MEQKEECEKKELPPAPPIGRKGQEEKVSLSPTRRARACVRAHAGAREDDWPGETPPDGYVNPCVPPTLGVALWHAHRTLGLKDPGFVREWYEDLSGAFWCDDSGRPVRNWGRTLVVWARNRARFEASRAVPGAGAAPLPGTDRDGIRRGAFAIQTENKVGLE